MFLEDKKLPLESKEMKDQRQLSPMGEIKKKKEDSILLEKGLQHPKGAKSESKGR